MSDDPTVDIHIRRHDDKRLVIVGSLELLKNFIAAFVGDEMARKDAEIAALKETLEALAREDAS